jgi:cyclase
MLKTRVIPCLLLKDNYFYKTVKFKDPIYLGDPINILRIFNEKEVDEILILDIGASLSQKGPNFPLLRDIGSECFMPLGYGGGIRSLDQMKLLFQVGFEKMSLNTVLHENPNLVTLGAKAFGSQSVVVSMDVKKGLFGSYEVMSRNGIKKTGRDPVEFAREMEQRGAGEILVNSIDRDGTMQGYDLQLLRMVSSAVKVPVIACGGAGEVADFGAAVKDGGASAVAAGSMFVFQGKHRAVLISFPEPAVLEGVFAK